ncbi:MAG: DNA alkylation repair protein [Thermoanaerobaculia bacterium]
MELKTVLAALEAAGTAQNRKIYRRHGVADPLYGVSYANQGKLAKKNRGDTELAIGLWKSGNHDARILAAMIADPEEIRSSLLDVWVRDLDNYVLTDAFSDLVSQSPFAKTKVARWTRSAQEFVGAAGWNVLARLARQDPELTDNELEEYLALIETEIHGRKNRSRHSMNSALIAIGIRNPKLERKALAVAKRIGKVEVDHGETSCKTPDAPTYIRKAVARRSQATR